MKHYCYFLFFSLLLLSCSSDPTITDQMYAEVESEYKKEGIDLETLLDDIEKHLISNGNLADEGGLSKVKFYEKIAGGSPLSTSIDRKILDKMLTLPFNYQLVNKFKETVKKKDSVAYLQSDFYTKHQLLATNASKMGAVTPANAAKAILSAFNAEDFERPYYRAFMLLSIAMTMEKETTYRRQIPKRLEPPENGIDPKKVITVQLNKINQVLINDVLYKNDKIESAYSRTHDKIGADAIIHFKVSQFALYENFMKIQIMIDEYGEKARENEADRSFHKHYDQLSDSQKQQVDNAHPINVVESKLD